MRTRNHIVTDSPRPSVAFLGSPTQRYIAAPTPTWKRIEMSEHSSPAFLGSPTQRYHRFPVPMQASAVTAGIKRILLKLRGAGSRATQPAQSTPSSPRAAQN